MEGLKFNSQQRMRAGGGGDGQYKSDLDEDSNENIIARTERTIANGKS